MRLRNLTGHPVDILTEDGRAVRLAPERTPALRIVDDLCGTATLDVDGAELRLVEVIGSAVRGLPPAAPDTLLIVGRVVAAACPERGDLVVPYDQVQDADGRVIGCRALARIVLERS